MQRDRDVKIALAHDYLTQRGGAERVLLVLARAFPAAPVHTSFYEPSATFADFRQVDVRPLPINRIRPLRRRYRTALPFLARSFSNLHLDVDVAICSSSGWAHGAQVSGRKVVYCHTPARWLYQPDRYLRGRGSAVRAAARFLRAPLARWDREAAESADVYLANSTVVAARIKSIYGIEAEVVPPPPAITPNGATEPIDGVEPGFVLCVSRLLPYKNVDAVLSAFAMLPDEHLVVAGGGPLQRSLETAAGVNVRFTGEVSDEQLRWLYANCRSLVAASHEDFGLTPLEAASFGKPTAALRWGGFLDTIVESTTGVFFDTLAPPAIEDAIRTVHRASWDESSVVAASQQFSVDRFVDRVRAIALGS